MLARIHQYWGCSSKDTTFSTTNKLMYKFNYVVYEHASQFICTHTKNTLAGYVSTAHCLWLITIYNDHLLLRLLTLQISPWLSNPYLTTLPSDIPPPGARAPRRPSVLIIKALRSHSDTPNSAQCRDLYPTTHNTHNRQTSTPLAGFESTIPARKQPQSHALDCVATGFSPTIWLLLQMLRYLSAVHDYFRLLYRLLRDWPDYSAVLSHTPAPEWHLWQPCLRLLWLVTQWKRAFCCWLMKS
jgi:hypothetical protein